jgi:hypothetical protein
MTLSNQSIWQVNYVVVLTAVPLFYRDNLAGCRPLTSLCHCEQYCLIYR